MVKSTGNMSDVTLLNQKPLKRPGRQLQGFAFPARSRHLLHIFDQNHQSARFYIRVGRVMQFVAMEDPFARIVGDEIDIVGLTGIDRYRVDNLRNGERMAVLRNDAKIMTVHIHRVNAVAYVGQPDAHRFAVFYLERIGIRK